MKVVIIGNSHLDQFKPHLHIPSENILQIPGASIRGLMNINSTTGLNKKIKDSCPDACIFHLGLVDIEFGYYYKSFLANEKLDKPYEVYNVATEDYITVKEKSMLLTEEE